MCNLTAYKREWFSNIRADILSGIVVALALIPEAIGFSIIAGVEPPPSHLHTVYGIVEVTKVAALGLLAAWADPQPRRRTVL